MAEGLLKKALRDMERFDAEVISAGVIAVDGGTVSEYSIEAMSEIGIDISGYRTNALTADLIRKADLILVMEKAHLFSVTDLVPEAKDKTFLLREFAADEANPAADSSVPDPIGRPVEYYKRCRDLLRKATSQMLKKL